MLVAGEETRGRFVRGAEGVSEGECADRRGGGRFFVITDPKQPQLIAAENSRGWPQPHILLVEQDEEDIYIIDG